MTSKRVRAHLSDSQTTGSRLGSLQSVVFLILMVGGIYLVLPLPFLGDQINVGWLHRLDMNVLPAWGLTCGGLYLALSTVPMMRLSGPFRRIGPLAFLAITLGLCALCQSRTTSDVGFLIPWGLMYLAAACNRLIRSALCFAWMLFLGLQVGAGVCAYATDYWQMHTPGFGSRATGFYGTPNVVYPVMLIAAFTFIAAPLAVGAKWGRFMFGALAAIAVVVLVLTYSRAGWLGASVGLLTLAIRSKSRFRWGAVALSLCFLLGSVFVRTHGAFVGSGEDASGRNRPLIWKHAVHVWEKSPWFGHGFSAFARPEVVGETPPGLPYLPGEPKNLYLNILVEQGLLGLALYGVFFAAALSISWRLWENDHAPPVDRAIAAALFPSLVAILVAGLVDTPAFGPLMRVPGTATLLVFIGLVAGADADLRREAKPAQ